MVRVPGALESLVLGRRTPKLQPGLLLLLLPVTQIIADMATFTHSLYILHWNNNFKIKDFI